MYPLRDIGIMGLWDYGIINLGRDTKRKDNEFISALTRKGYKT